jgi:uncharacterized protein (DUF302 family)
MHPCPRPDSGPENQRLVLGLHSWCEMGISSLTHLAGRAPTLTFVLEESFESALKTLRRAFAEDQLCVAVELDAAKRIRRALNLAVSPCRILLVENPIFMLEATAIDRSSAVFIPLHVVVSGNGANTLIHVLNPDYSQLRDSPVGVRIPLARIQDQVLGALRKVADRTRDADELADRG